MNEFVIKNGFISKGDSIVNGTISGDTLNLTTIPSNDNSQTQVLVRNNTTGLVEYRDASTLAGMNTYVTGFTYNDNNTFTIFDNDGGSFPATFNQVSGLTVNGDLTVTGTSNLNVVTATTLDGSILLSGGTNLTTVIESLDTYVTGGTVSVPATDNSNDGTIGLFYKNFDGTPRILPFKDTFTTGSTYDNGTALATFDRNDGTSYTLDLSTIDVNDTFITGFTYNDANTLTISRNDGVDLSTSINTMTGLTVNGDITVIGTSNLNAVTATTIDFDLNYTGATAEGRLSWNFEDATLDLGMGGGNVTQQIGQEIYYRVKNQSGSTISNGRVVRNAGSVGASGRILGEYMIADGTYPFAKTLGIATEDILNGSDGLVTEFGVVRGLNTTGSLYGESWSDGDVLYVSPTIPGGLTNVEPQAPNQILEMGIVLFSNVSNGSIFVDRHLSTKLGDISDVQTTGVTNGDLIVYNSATTVWDYSKTLTGDYDINGSLSATTLDGNTILSGGTNLTTIIESLDTYVTGGTVSVPATDNSNSGNIGLFYKNSDGIPRTLPFEDTYTTGSTYDNGTALATFNKNDGTNYTLDLSTIDVNDTFVTGTTFSSNEATLTRNDGTEIFKLSGGTNVTLSNPSTNKIDIDVTVPINTQNVLWVDSMFGDDGTALPNRQDKSYLTIGAALTAAVTTGTTVIVRPGTYPEEGLVVNDNVSLVSEGGWQVTTIGPTPSSATSDILELKQNAYIEGFSVNVPEGSFNGIFASNSGGTNSAYNVTFYGNGTTGSTGVGLFKSGGGKLIGTGIRVEGGGIQDCLKVDSGVLALEGIHIPQSDGSIENVLLVTTSGGTLAGRAQMLSFNSGNNNVTNVVKTTGGVTGVIPTALIFTPNIFNATNAYTGDGEFETLNMLGGRFENVTLSVNLDLAGTAQESTYRINANHQPLYLYNKEAAALAEFSLTFTQQSTEEFDSSFNVFGAEQMSVGFAERGTSVSVGRGSPYTTGMVVLTTDNTASSTSDGGNLTDVSVEAKSKTGSTFTFQGAGVNHSILVGVQRQDLNGDPLKFYGLETFVNSQASSGGTYVFESWNGSEWVEVMGMCTNVDEGYSYGTDYFIRPNNDEFVRLGLDEFIESPIDDFAVSAVTWSNKTINSVDAYWLRLRIDTTVTTLPNFERFKILDSIYSFSKNGVPSAKGLAQFRKTINLNGNIWSGTDGMGNALANFDRTVGSGANAYTHYFEDSNMDDTGKSINIQFPLPIGTCTAFPINFKLVMEVNGAAGAEIDLDTCVLTTSALPEKVGGTLIADSSGGTKPVKRSIVDTPSITTVNPYQNAVTILPEGYTPGVTTWADIDSKVFELDMGEINVQSIYEGDIVMLKFECTTIDTNANIVIYSLIVEGVSHQDGKGI